MAYVLLSSELGIYLGGDEDTAYWSNAPTPFEAAPCFESADEIEILVTSWGPQTRAFSESLKHAEVTPDVCDAHGVYRYASPVACVAAGLQGWVTARMAPAHESLYGERPRIH